MKRSEINEILAQADAFIRSFGFVLPPFAYWLPKEMLDRKAEIAGILSGRLGWDITDFGQGKFDDYGLFLFTVRNGRQADLARPQELRAPTSVRHPIRHATAERLRLAVRPHVECA